MELDRFAERATRAPCQLKRQREHEGRARGARCERRPIRQKQVAGVDARSWAGAGASEMGVPATLRALEATGSACQSFRMRARSARAFERGLLGALMMAAAYLLERALLRRAKA